VPEELKRDCIEGILLPLLRGVARVLAPAYLYGVDGFIYVHTP